MALCTQSCDKYVTFQSDINSRTGALQSSLPLPDWVEHWKRTSSDPDEKINARRRALVEDCTLYNLCILNGTSLETASPGRLTSWQPAGQSAIDYAIMSQNLLSLVHKFHVFRGVRLSPLIGASRAARTGSGKGRIGAKRNAAAAEPVHKGHRQDERDPKRPKRGKKKKRSGRVGTKKKAWGRLVGRQVSSHNSAKIQRDRGTKHTQVAIWSADVQTSGKWSGTET
jgi:hypothetical protein